MLLSDTTIGVVGGGVVGLATAKAYAEHVSAICIADINPKRRTASLMATLSCDIVFVCLPTPQKEGSLRCDTSFIEKALEDMVSTPDFDANGKPIVVIRSTVPVGFTQVMQERFPQLSLLHSPEFLTARCAALDAATPTRNIVGYTLNRHSPSAAFLDRIYALRWPHVPVIEMPSNESELVKLATNSFFAVKIAFWNELYQFAVRQEGMNWDRVIETILGDGRIHPSHTKIPGPDGSFGFGGSCLPKDLANLITSMNPHIGDGVGIYSQSPVLSAALVRNERDRNYVK